MFLLFDETANAESFLSLLSSFMGGILLIRGGKEIGKNTGKSTLLIRTTGALLSFLIALSLFSVAKPLFQNEIRRHLFSFVLSSGWAIADGAVVWAAAETAAEYRTESPGRILTMGYGCGFARLFMRLMFPFPKIRLYLQILAVLLGIGFLFLFGRNIRKTQNTSR